MVSVLMVPGRPRTPDPLYCRSGVNGQAIQSGEDLIVVVTGLANAPDASPAWTPAFRVRDARTGVDVHSVTGLQRDIATPVHGEFEYQLTIQMNLQPGSYEVQAFIWDSSTHDEVVQGPRLAVEVLERMPFYNQVQLNSRWCVRKDGRDARLRREITNEAPRDHPRRRLGNAPLSDHEIGEQAAVARVRQANDLLSADDAHARRLARVADHHDSARPRGVRSVAW
jgi:hypothetical protein